jgi:hypothetical protein
MEPPIQPKLVTKAKLVGMIATVLAVIGLELVGEYRVKGHVSARMLGACVFGLVVSCAIIGVMTWYANKPEN